MLIVYIRLSEKSILYVGIKQNKIKNTSKNEGILYQLLSFFSFNLNDFTIFVVSAARTSPMGQPWFMTLWAL